MYTSESSHAANAVHILAVHLETLAVDDGETPAYWATSAGR